MTTQGQGHSLTVVQGHSDSQFQTYFPQKSPGQLKPNFMESAWDVGNENLFKFSVYFRRMTSLFMAYQQNKFCGFPSVFNAFSMTFFSVQSYQNTRIAITHVCFNALTFARSLRRCLNTRPAALYSNSFLGAWQMIMHEKMFDPYIDFVYRLEAGFRFHEHYEDNHRH